MTTAAARPEAAPFDAIVIGGSAGALPAAGSLLRSLPADCAVPVVLMLHLPPDSALDQFFARLPFEVRWVEAGTRLTQRHLLLCPPRAFVEMLPDGTCTVAPAPGGALDKPIDRLFESAARSLGARAIGVLLSGMGEDGAAGAARLHAAGGRVLVQSQGTAEFPDMPNAAVEAGAVDLVVPLPDLGQVVGEIVAGTPQPQLSSETRAIAAVFGGPGAARASLREVPWSRTPLGPVMSWPPSLRSAARTTLALQFPAVLRWGPAYVQMANDAWLRHQAPAAVQGVPAREAWPEAFPGLERDYERIARTGEPLWQEDREGAPGPGAGSEAYFTSSSTPVHDEAGTCAGILTVSVETTARVLAERRLRMLRELTLALAGASNAHEACTRAAKVLAGNPNDLPNVALYLADSAGSGASLAASVGAAPEAALTPHTVSVHAQGRQAPLERAIATAVPFESGGLASLPLRPVPDEAPAGALVVATSPRLAFDAAYRTFIELVAARIASALASIRARERERERLERLAALDEAKTEFFANVSHEFRTPLTLMLPPLEQLLHARQALPPRMADEVDVAARNARRLLRLVDSLLDFSQIETRRGGAVLEPCDLGAHTRDIASAFRSATEQAGLRLTLDIDPELPPVPVNREMWEKVVSNLLSNALKFTFEGGIFVRLRRLRLHAELEVRDTGVGIPKEELANVFKRFHRVRGTRARTAEGAGIGLAIVKDLVERLGGQLTAASTPGKGSVFTVWLPLKSLRLQAEAAPGAPAPPTVAAELADEAARWLALSSEAPPDVAEDLLDLPAPPAAESPDAARPRLLVADDNADVRAYLRRLLAAEWEVQVASDGAEALRLARRTRPDLILADVMMPVMTGFELLEAVRADEALRSTPLVLVTARAGEEAAIEGLLAGADDYIAKPFSPREMAARLRGQLALARMRRRAADFNGFLVRVTDAVRNTRSPLEIAGIACRMLLERLCAQMAHWTDVDPARDEYVVFYATAAPGFEPLAGRWPLAGWEPFTQVLGSGRELVIEDAQADAQIPAEVKARLAARPAAAIITVPCMVEGRLSATISVNFAAPRRCTGEEVALVEGVAARCWAEVQRARAEEALREREAWKRGQREALEAALNGEPLAVSLGALVRTAVHGLGGETRAAFYLAGEGGTGLHHIVGMPSDYAEAVDGFVVGPESPACGLAAYRGEPVVTRDVKEEPRWRQWSWLAEKFDFRGCWSFPIHAAGGRLIASLAVYSRAPRVATERDLELVALLTDTGSIVIAQHLEAQARRQAEQALREYQVRLAREGSEPRAA